MIDGALTFDEAAPRADGIAFDGRLDNVDELQSALFGNNTVAMNDAALVLEAWRRWRLDALSRLIGDFAFALWDARAGTLVLARDAFGIRPLYYRSDPSGVCWSSSVIKLLPEHYELDEQYIAGYLTSTSSTEETPFRSIASVPAGGAIVVRDGIVQHTTFWSDDPRPKLRLRDDSEYEERFRELFVEAVRVRMRGDGAVASELSGGLDSSSIVCVADALLRRGSVKTPRLHTISHVYGEARSSDERPFIEHVERQRGERGHHVLEDDFRILRTIEEDEPFLDFPTPFALAVEQYAEVRRFMREAGARVLLSGTGGDQLVWGEVGPPVMLADALLQGRPLQLHRELVAWSRALGTSYLQLVRDGVVTPLLPARLQTRLMKHARTPAWIDASFAKRTRFSSRMVGWPGERQFRLRGEREEYNSLQNAIWLASRAHAVERGAFEIRYPFLHRPLVEFALAIPLEQKLRPGETRSILRRALRGFLPEAIARRTTKQGPDEAIHRAVAREGARLERIVATSRVCARGYARKEELREALQKMRHGVNVSTPAFVRILSLELWLRDLERSLAHRRSRTATRGTLPPAANEQRRIERC